MLFGGGGGGFGMGGEGGGGFGLIHILIIGLIAYLIFKFVRSRQMLNGGASPAMMGSNISGTSFSPAAPVSQSLQLQQDDAASFSKLFLDVQQAWSDRDFARLQNYMTPEMVQYFNDELAGNVSRGVANKVEQVQIQQMDPVESWSEYNLDYASIRLQWTAKDYMIRLDRQPGDSDYVAEGSSGAVTPQQEQWTFVRSQGGGRWLLSAIQQMG